MAKFLREIGPHRIPLPRVRAGFDETAEPDDDVHR
tara:strand:+ start:349 stop:453 length:105 start_codon:yes stop_codon:yes gene_type:complete